MVLAAEDDGPSAVYDGLGGLMDVECFDEADEGFRVRDGDVGQIQGVSQCLFPKRGVWRPRTHSKTYANLVCQVLSLSKYIKEKTHTKLREPSTVIESGWGT